MSGAYIQQIIGPHDTSKLNVSSYLHNLQKNNKIMPVLASAKVPLGYPSLTVFLSLISRPIFVSQFKIIAQCKKYLYLPPAGQNSHKLQDVIPWQGGEEDENIDK